MKNLVFIIIFLFSHLNANAKSIAKVDDYLEFLNSKIKIEYKNILKTPIEINAENLPYADCLDSCENTKQEITYLLHGFMGSPHEMKYISNGALLKKSIIFNDLIFGHGLNSEIANIVKKELFYKHAEKNLDFIFSNFDKVNLIGFSTGGLIISQYLKNHPQFLDKVGKVQLISPFYIPNIKAAPIAGNILSFFTNKVSVDFFYKYSGFPDVEIMTLEPSFYQQEIPVQSALEISKLAQQFISDSTKPILLKNIEIYLTKNDQVLSFANSYDFLKNIYPNAQINTFEGKNAPHHLMAPLVSKYAISIKDNF